MHHAKNVAKSIISDSKSVLCIKCMLYHKIVSGTYFWYIINLSIDILCFILYRLNKRNCDKNDSRIFKSRPKDWSSICLSKRSCYLGFAPATVLIS